MYVLIVYDKYDDRSIAAVIGPLGSLQDCHKEYYELFGEKYHPTVSHKVTRELPSWMK